MRPLKCIQLLSSILITSFIQLSGYAQLRADFSMDNAGGCSPLTTTFTNRTTGASPTTTYEWDFGNGMLKQITEPS